jgi:hypothetical protein
MLWGNYLKVDQVLHFCELQNGLFGRGGGCGIIIGGGERDRQRERERGRDGGAAKRRSGMGEKEYHIQVTTYYILSVHA